LLPIVHHPDFVAPLRAGHRFPMSKYGYLREALIERGLLEDGGWLTPRAADPAMLARAHDQGYVERIFSETLSDTEIRRIGLPQTERVRRRSRLACAGTLLAARFAMERGIACNTAGGSHHARFEYGAGYCVFNDVAVAIRSLQREGGARTICIIDCDVHQGDGTAMIFADDPGVFTFSIHAQANYPFSKASSDLDIGLSDGIRDAAYLKALEGGLARVAQEGPFDLAFYNAGVDVYEHDRLGRLSLSEDGIRQRDAMVFAWALSQGTPIVGVLGGGYDENLRHLAARQGLRGVGPPGLSRR